MATEKWNFKIHDNEHEIVMKEKGFKIHLTVDVKEISLKNLPVTKENSAKRHRL